MKLEDGMYVRTKDTDNCNCICIRRIYEIDEDNDNYFYVDDDVYDSYGDSQVKLTKDDIQKASHNITDLIEVGDYVNGLRVEKSKYGELYTSYTYMGGDIGFQQETYTTFLKNYEEDYIHSIVTKEQFEQMSYHI